MRLIDADALKKTTAFINGAMYKVVTAKDIEEAPTVDAVKVVRCKVCKNGLKVGDDLLCNHLSGLCGLNVVVNNNEFCSYGERANK